MINIPTQETFVLRSPEERVRLTYQVQSGEIVVRGHDNYGLIFYDVIMTLANGRDHWNGLVTMGWKREKTP